MGGCNFPCFSLHLLLFSLIIFTITANSQLPLSPNTLLIDPCNFPIKVNCGHGTCVPSNTSILGFDCDCSDGWKKIANLTLFPLCVLPNCSVDFQCGNGTPPPPPPPLPPINFTSPCNFVWCGDGNCVVNGTEHYCECYDGSTNLMNTPALPCMQQCYFGADCDKFGIGSPQKSGSPGNGPVDAGKSCARNLQALTIVVLSAIFLTWI